MYKILILCTGNSCRSQMAHSWLESFLQHKAIIFSAGTKPEKVNTYAVKVMLEKNIDISKNTSNHVSEYDDINFDFVITVCDNARELCPVFPNTKRVIHHSFIDPAEATGEEHIVLEIYRKVRDELKLFLIDFCNQQGLKRV